MDDFMSKTASTIADGHKANGQFAKGNKCSKGNPFADRIGQWRKALVEAVTPEDIRDIAIKLVETAKQGKGWAIQLLLDRCLGKPQASLDVTSGGEILQSANPIMAARLMDKLEEDQDGSADAAVEA